MNVDLKLHGPFTFVPGPHCLFDNDLASERGVYLWTIECDDGYLVNYVGETGKVNKRTKVPRTFSERLNEQLRWFLGGRDGIVDASAFVQGKREFLLPKKSPIQDFLHDYSRWANHIYLVARAYRVFLAPMDLDDRIRERIEQAIIRSIHGTNDRCKDFLYNRPNKDPSHPEISVRVEACVTLHGVAKTLTA